MLLQGNVLVMNVISHSMQKQMGFVFNLVTKILLTLLAS